MECAEVGLHVRKFVRSAVAAEREYSDRKIVFDYCSGPAWPPVCRTVSGLAAVSESGRRVSGAGFFAPFFRVRAFRLPVRSSKQVLWRMAAMTITAIAAMARISPDDSFSHGRFGF